jgi:hypothetical protein
MEIQLLARKANCSMDLVMDAVLFSYHPVHRWRFELYFTGDNIKSSEFALFVRARRKRSIAVL